MEFEMDFKKEDEESWNEELTLFKKNSSETKKFTILTYFSSEQDRKECLTLQETIMRDRISIFKAGQHIACNEELQYLLERYEQLLDNTERSIEYYASLEHPKGTWLSLRETYDYWVVGNEKFSKKEWIFSIDRKENILWAKRRAAYKLFILKLLLDNLRTEEHNTFHNIWINCVNPNTREKLIPFLFNSNKIKVGEEELSFFKFLEEVNPTYAYALSPFDFNAYDFIVHVREGHSFFLKSFYLLLEGEKTPFNNNQLQPRLSCGNKKWAKTVLKMGGMFGPDKSYKFLEIVEEDKRYFVTMEELTPIEYKNIYSVAPLKYNKPVLTSPCSTT